MNRTLVLKLAYPLLVVLGIVALTRVLGGVEAEADRLKLAAVLVVALLLPGRLSGWLFRDLYRSRAAFARGEFEQAARFAEAEAMRLKKNPKLKPLLWLTWSIYTTDVEAMTLNNLGAAQMMRGNVDAAKWAFETALKLDARYPMPYFNLAILAGARGDEAAAKSHAAQATRLGYTGGGSDRAVQMGQELLARLEGRA